MNHDLNWRFLENITSWACLLGSGLKVIFHCIVQSLILLISLFNLFADVITSWTTEKREVSSANSLKFVIKSLERLLIYIKNDNDPSIDPWGTPALIYWSLKRIVHLKQLFCFLQFKKWVVSNSFPEIPFCFNFCKNLYAIPDQRL